MPRAKPTARERPETLSFSVPHWMAEQIREDMRALGHDRYGGQAAWFRQVWQEHADTRGLRARLATTQERNRFLESTLNRVRSALNAAIGPTP